MIEKPTKSQQGLTRCGACRAHIVASDRPSTTVCPFCGANLFLAKDRPALPIGRSGLLAASLLAFSACGGAEPSTEPTEPTVVTQPEPETPAPDVYEAPVDNGRNSMVEAYGSPPDEVQVQPAPPPPVPAPAYGIAPGPRDRFDPPPDEPAPAPMYGVAP